MSHNVLLKHGYKVVFEASSFTTYQLYNKLVVVWFSGKCEVYDV